MLQNMLKLIKVRIFDTGIKHSKHCVTPMFHVNGICNFSSQSYSFDSPLSSPQRVDQDCVVGIFWDVDNKLHKLYPPFEAATRLKTAAEKFGFVKYKNAYANRGAFRYVQVNRLENAGVVKAVVPYVCKMCGRRFDNNDKLINHFKIIHERERTKRLNEIESARGSKRVNLVKKYAAKMEKYKYAAREILNLKVGYSLAEELKRAGFWVREVSDNPRAADVALRNHIVDMMDHRKIGCVVLVSDDSDFVEVLEEAKLRCLKTVVIGDGNDGALKRVADASFSWAEIIRGKSKKGAVSVVGRWKYRDVHKKLESTYDLTTDGESESDGESEESDFESFLSDKDDDFSQKENAGAWWELKSDATRSPLISQVDEGDDLQTKS